MVAHKIPVALAVLLLTLSCGGGGSKLGLGTPTLPPPLDPAQYLLLETGTLPVILSAPHGGTLNLAGFSERTTGTTVLDTNTQELAQAIQTRLLIRTGKKAHLVVALASRKFVDFNRDASEAYEATAIAPLYEAYHQAIRTATSAARTQSLTGALLVDLHGQGDAPATTYRGTRDGRTAALTELYAVPGGLLAALAPGGIVVFPPTSGGTENPAFNGGFIVATYGLMGTGGIQAVQLEFGMNYRQSAQIPITAAAVVEAVVAHLQVHAAGTLSKSASD